MIKKLYILNFALFVVIVSMSALLMTASYPVPPKPDIEKYTKPTQNRVAEETNKVETTEKNYKNLDKAPLFSTLYPKPTPKPTPVPTPKPDPKIEKLTSTWILVAVLGDQAMFEDKKTKEDWMMSIGETRPVKYKKGKKYDIKLKSTNENEFSATISFEGRLGEQTRTLSMF